METTILHISDLHVGANGLVDQDVKDRLPGGEAKTGLSRLADYLSGADIAPDYVIVTGDVADRGDVQGLKEFREWVLARIDAGSFPSADRVVVVPGNNDVTREEDLRLSDTDRYGPFFETLGKAFPHAFLPGCDPRPTYPTRKDLRAERVGGLQTDVRGGDVTVRASYPFLLDNSRDLLIYAFNSTLSCGVHLEDSSGLLKKIESLESVLTSTNPVLGGTAKEIASGYWKTLLVDAGRLGAQQLDYFKNILTRLRSGLGQPKFARLTKIACLHHHISHLWDQQIEMKRFESVVDASQLKQYLHEFGFDIVLHGHKHTNHVGLDASMVPVGSSAEFSPICIVSGGAVGGQPRPGDAQSFKVVCLPEDDGPRTTARIDEWLLKDCAAPTVTKNARTYQIPLSARLPDIHHDWPDLKKALDDYLVARLDRDTPNWAGGAAEQIRDGQIELPAAHPELLASGLRYRFTRTAVGQGGEQVFVDVILATSRLDFKQTARIYWVLSDVVAKNHSGPLSRLLLIIANLENTALFRGQHRGEVKESVQQLKGRFQPAVKAGAMKIVDYRIRQEEVDELVRQVEDEKRRERERGRPKTLDT